MRKKKARAVLDAHLKSMRNALHLHDWKIEVIWGVIEGCSSDTIGLCESDPKYRQATIWINHDKHTDKPELMNTLRHELLHILHAEMLTFRKAVYQNLERGEEVVCSTVWSRATEDIVRNLEDMLDGLGFGPKELAAKGKTQ